MRRRVLLAVVFGLACIGMSVQTVSAQEVTTQTVAADSLLPKLSYDYFFLEAMVQRQKGNNDSAFELLRHCVELNPRAAEAYYFLAQYYGAMKNTEQTHACIQKAAELEPDNATYMETLAQSYMNRQELGKATEVVEKLYSQNMDREDLLETLARLYEQQQDYEHAIDALSRLEAIDGKNERLAYAKSELYSQMGDTEAALAELKALADQYPNDLNYLCLYADQLMREVNPAKAARREEMALQIFGRVLREEPDNVHGQVSMLNYYKSRHDEQRTDSMSRCILMNRNTNGEQKVFLLRQMIHESEQAGGDSTRMLSLFRQMLAIPEPDADVAMLCVAYMDLKKMPRDTIRPVLEQILDMQPDNAGARLQLVSYAWDEQDKGRVIELCKAARQYNPDEMAFYYYQGMAYYQEDNKDEALNAFRNGVGVITEQSNPAIVSDFYAVMGDLLHQKGLTSEAFESYDSCLVWKEDNISCLNNYAYYLSELGQQLDRAEQMSYKTVKAEPQNATYLDTYAWILFMQKRYSEARIYIEQALQNDTDSSAVIMEHAGDIYIQNKEVDRALSLWRAALKKAPGNKVLARKVKLKKYLKE